MLSANLKRLRKERRLTLEEIAAALGTTKQTIHRYENGIITNIPPDKIAALARVLAVSPSDLMGWKDSAPTIPSVSGVLPISVKNLPILGEIACGEPIYASEEHESFAAADEKLDADFCLRAHGDSMMGARIFDGDIVFIRSQSTVDNGEIAAVIINDEATLKRVYFYPEDNKLVLSPENPRYAPLVYVGGELENIKIIGKAVAFHSTVI